MTNNKQAFINWYTKHHPQHFIRSLQRTPIVEIQAIPTGSSFEGHLDKNYITCSVGSKVPLIGMQYSGEEKEHLFVFIGVDLDKAQSLLTGTTTNHRESKTVGTGVRMPTSINAFTKWCERHNINPVVKQRVPSFDPHSVGLKGMIQSYYWIEFITDDLNKVDEQLNKEARELNGLDVNILDYVPHKQTSETNTLVLIKATGYNRKNNILEKALREALLFRTEEACIYYAELFLQRRVQHIDVSKINWNKKPFYGIEIVKAEANTGVGEISHEQGNNNQLPEETSNNLSYDF